MPRTIRTVRLSSILTAAVLMFGVPAHAESFTTFQARAEGCSGGGDVCGGFPLVPAGSATSTYTALADGSIDLTASVDGGVPSLACQPGVACVPAIARYHAEAVGETWVDATTPAASRVDVTVDYGVDELSVKLATTLGGATGAARGTLAVMPAPGSADRCSDGGSVAGVASLLLDTAPGRYSFTTTLECRDGSMLPAGTWRVALQVRVAATTDGGSADAEGHASLNSVTVDAA